VNIERSLPKIDHFESRGLYLALDAPVHTRDQGWPSAESHRVAVDR